MSTGPWNDVYARVPRRRKPLPDEDPRCETHTRRVPWSQQPLTGKTLRRAFDAQKGACLYCETPFRRRNGTPLAVRELAKKRRLQLSHKSLQYRLHLYHVEHKDPVYRGGGNGPSNIALACPSCNLAKGTKNHYEYLATLRDQRGTRSILRKRGARADSPATTSADPERDHPEQSGAADNQGAWPKPKDSASHRAHCRPDSRTGAARREQVQPPHA